ncbi:MAG: ORF6N domain-containing protein [Agriterribacter sp.]
MQLQLIQNRIYDIRGKKAILDFDLAVLYEIETKYLKRAVRQNAKRFPPDFMFELTKLEFESLRCSLSTSNQRGGVRYAPFAFTEQGVAMLSSVLHTDKAIQMNIAIMRAFVEIRVFMLDHAELSKQVRELKEQINKHDDELSQIYATMQNLIEEKLQEKKWEERTLIGFRTRHERESILKTF